MYFKNVQDNEKLIARLEEIVKKDNVSHAYIFEGDSCADKKSFAESFVKGILCMKNSGEGCGECGICHKIEHGNCEDLTYISAQGDSVKDSEILKMQERLKTKPFGERNVVIIEDSDKMTLRAQNRLLKTLEEPPGNSVIILLSENIESLVQTVQSRCVKYRINSFGGSEADSMLDEAEKIVEAMLNRAPFYLVKERVDKLVKDKDEAAVFLDSLQIIYRKLLFDRERKLAWLKNEEIMDKIYAVEDARRKLRQGVSTAYALRNLILKIGG